MRRQLAVASPPSKSFVRAHHTQILGGFVVGSLTVLMVAMLYYLIKKKLVPALRQRQSLHEPGQKGEQIKPRFSRCGPHTNLT